MSASIKERTATSHLFGSNAFFVEALYEDFLHDPNSVPEHWRAYFGDLLNGGSDRTHLPLIDQFRNRRPASGTGGAVQSAEIARKEASVLKMINAFRVRGHQRANLDPLGLTQRPDVPDLELAFHDLGSADLDSTFHTGSLAAPDEMRLRDILNLLKGVYCGTIGYEYMHITDTNQRRWIQSRIEGNGGRFELSSEQRQRVFDKLVAAEGLERYLHTKYVGQKRFSLEGADSLIPLLNELIQHEGAQGVREVVMGMAHRGRINVLVNIMGKSPAIMFEEFEGKGGPDDPSRSGDVKYHMGFSSDVETPGGPVHLALAFNPSHLEIISPVVAGSTRARQTRRGHRNFDEVLPVLIHGDAAFAGQGVVMELFNMSQARGFAVGGTFHVIVNNQIGFTTSNPIDARSTLYCTEVAKMVQAPIFHVNADDPDAVIFATQLAADFRRKFDKDVVLDLVCYRKHGHNEADEPAATQPVMYKTIRDHDSAMNLYQRRLSEDGVLEESEARERFDRYRKALDEGEEVTPTVDAPPGNTYTVNWHPYMDADPNESVDTGVAAKSLTGLARTLGDIPEDFQLHARVRRIVDDRLKMAAGDMPMDWGFAETLAYATLLRDGYHVRLVGQDSGRGTFFHRHAVLHEQDSGRTLVPLSEMSKDRYGFTVIDSLLSEEAVLGFEYGYATADPHCLVIWEAQFGDFVNGAQVVIDQFIASGETKWGRLCGLVMFLPHGYEGQGPEHSSARLERFMQLCAQNNLQVCVPTTPAQMFHMLRRQMLRHYRKPLIVMTPKSLLRHKASVSALEDLERGTFQRLIADTSVDDNDAVKRVVLCAGKVYYDLLKKREDDEIENVPIIRVEQLYPFPRELLIQELAHYPNAEEIVWCQEEPLNQGAWYQIRHHLQHCIGEGRSLTYAGRSRSASPATGYHQQHIEEQKTLVEQALTLGAGATLDYGVTSKQ